MTALRWHYAHGKFSEALASMAASSRPFKERLERAYFSNIAHLQSSDFPPAIESRFAKLRESLTSVPPKYEGEGSIHATIRAMHPKKAKKVIQEIASIEYQLAQVHYD